jgi:hypothetical protein
MRHLQGFATLGLAAAAIMIGAPGARADVTIEQKTTFDLNIIKAHGTSTESTTADKQRRDSDTHCEGFMSLMCGNSQSGEIVRLDKDVTWQLDPKHKTYRESPFPTPEQRAEAERKMKEMMEKVKQCPAMQQQAAAPDTSKCEMTPPTIDVKATDQHATIAGHDTQLTQVALSQSCRNAQTGDECKYALVMDAWLTQDQIAGVDEHKAFQMAYLKKLGLDPNSEFVQQQMKQFLAPYQDSLKQLAGKSGDLKGYPLKSAVRIAFGGEHCAAAKQQSASSGGGSSTVGDAGSAAQNAATSASAGAAGAAASSAASNAAGNSVAGSILGSAAGAFSSNIVGGLFKKKAAAPAPAAAATTNNGLPPGMIQVGGFTSETTSIVQAPVPAAQFDIPADWKLVVPKPQADKEKEFTCPSAKGGS